MDASRKRQASSSRVKLIGPAQQPFGSFRELATFSLDSNCPNWRNYANPQSYILPPLFYYKHADKSDEKCERAKTEIAALALKNGASCKSGHQDFRFVIDRGSDEAEHAVYKAIDQLIDENIRAPFVAIHSLNMDRTKYLLKDVFPTLQWESLRANLMAIFREQLADFYGNVDESCLKEIQVEFSDQLTGILMDSNALRSFPAGIKCTLEDVLERHWFPSSAPMQRCQNLLSMVDCIQRSLVKAFSDHFREYDFVIIGPNVGIVVIEVKHSHFGQKDFCKGRDFLPTDYLKGLKQLQSFDNVMSLIEDCTGVRVPEEAVRKILFTPNLEKERFRNWYENLGNTKDAVSECLACADYRWFTEDMPLYESLKTLLQNSTQKISNETFEVYSSILIGLASIIAFPNDPGTYTMDYFKLGECKAISQEADRVETQDPLEQLIRTAQNSAPPKKHKPASSSADLNVVKLQKVIILTPEQKIALEGPNRQFIVGPAGAGKTIILQAKALEMLREGKSVLVFCPPWFAPKYRQLFDQNGFKNYDIRSSWGDLLGGPYSPNMLIHNVRNLGSDAYEIVRGALTDNASGFLKNATFMQILAKYDGFLVDDMTDRFAWNKTSEEQVTFASKLINTTADLLLFLIIMASARMLCPSNVVWIAFDYWTDQENRYFVADYTRKHALIRAFLNLETKISSSIADYYALTKLDRVMRCPQNVFNSAYHFGDDRYGPAVKAQLGHKIQGKHSKIKIVCKNAEDGVELIWGKVKKILYELSEKNFSFDKICLILGWGWTDSESRPSFFRKCEEDQIPACTLLSSFPLAVEYTTSVGKSSLNDGVLTICGGDQVSSAEWPIVIFVDYIDMCRPFRKITNIRDEYRGRSRATAELIEIIATRPSDIPQRHRNHSDSICTTSAYIKERGHPLKREWKQLANMAGSVRMLAYLAFWLARAFPHCLEYKRGLLQVWTRRRHYSVSEIDLVEKRKLHPVQRRSLQESGVLDMYTSV